MKNKVAEALMRAKRPLLIGHVNADGDCVGSVIALAELLAQRGARPVMAMEGGLPHRYGFFSDTEILSAPGPGQWDCAVAVDVADTERMGVFAESFFASPLRVCIDHHASNTGFADISWVEQRAAAGELILQLADELDAQITPLAADALYTAISTDTGNFAYSNTDAQCLCAAARLAKAGARISFLHDNIYGKRTLGATNALGAALLSLKLFKNGKIAVMCITQDDLARCGAASEDCSMIVNYARDIEGVEIGLFVRETVRGTFKLSFRSNSYANVGALAEKFGGGGHFHAAGGEWKRGLDEGIERIIEEAGKII